MPAPVADGPILAAPEHQLMPAVFHAADATATAAQRRHFLWLHAMGSVAVVAAAAGALSWQLEGVDLAALAAALLFGVQLVLVLGSTLAQDDKAWYDARAGAESMKTMAWRYGVGAEPFPCDISAEAAQAALAERGRRILLELRDTLRPAAAMLTDPMPGPLTTLRGQPLAVRQEVYLSTRLAGQLSWYERRSRSHQRRARTYLVMVGVISGVGLLGGLSRAVVAWGVALDTAGICGALVGSLLAVSQARQHAVLARAYAVTAHEIAFLLAEARPTDEAQWARWVEGAEDALSREHTMWLATHGRTRA